MQPFLEGSSAIANPTLETAQNGNELKKRKTHTNALHCKYDSIVSQQTKLWFEKLCQSETKFL